MLFFGVLTADIFFPLGNASYERSLKDETNINRHWKESLVYFIFSLTFTFREIRIYPSLHRKLKRVKKKLPISSIRHFCDCPFYVCIKVRYHFLPIVKNWKKTMAFHLLFPKFLFVFSVSKMFRSCATGCQQIAKTSLHNELNQRQLHQRKHRNRRT